MSAYYIAKQARQNIQDRLDAASKTLKAIPEVGSGPMGLTPDHVRLRPEYRAAKQAYEMVWAELRAFNAVFVKQFKKEIAGERKLRFPSSDGTKEVRIK